MSSGLVGRSGHADGVRGSRDFGRLWSARAVSDLGSAVGSVALPLVAVLVLDASTFQVSLLAALSAVAGAVLALPLGAAVEYRRKRPAMILADVGRAGLLASVPVAAGLGVLTFAQLCVVAMLNVGLTVVFGAASQAHLRDLVGRGALGEANGRLESTLWLAVSAGPALGGALVGLVGAAWTLLADAVSFCVSATAVRRIRRPESPPPARVPRSRWADLSAGWRFLFGHPPLRRCLLSYTVFSGSVMLLSPLETVFLLRTLDARPWQYGLVMGVPCLAGLVGARLAPRLMRRLGTVRTLWWTSVARGPWMLLLPLAAPGHAGLLLCAAVFTGVLGCAALSNTTLTTYRQVHTPDQLMARAAMAWSVTIRTVQPVFVLLGGLVAAQFGVRAAIWAGAAVLALSAFALPRPVRHAIPVPDGPACRTVRRGPPDARVPDAAHGGVAAHPMPDDIPHGAVVAHPVLDAAGGEATAYPGPEPDGPAR